MGRTLENRLIIIALIVYAVGIAGLNIPATRSLFLSLTPLNISLSFVTALFFQKKWNFTFLLSLAIIGISGFAIEYAGVHSGIIFGEYNYGRTLGTGWEGIPFLIGVNWAALVYYSSSFLAKSMKNQFAIALTGAAMLTVFDWFMEPVAVNMDMWTWESATIPIRNYVAWFIFSFFLILIFQLMNKPEKNRVAAAFLLIQAAFFAALNLIIYLGEG